MKRLIKLNDQHYIIVDNSEIKEGDWWYCNITKTITNAYSTEKTLKGLPHKGSKKITHTTQPLINKPKNQPYNTLILLEVEELINGYDLHRLALRSGENTHGFRAGFQSHQELVKDKLFTIEDMRMAFENGYYRRDEQMQGEDFPLKEREVFIQSLLPKTEWNIEIDEQNKITLI